MLSSGSSNSSSSFFEFKKQASFYIKEKIKTARLALTDVTPTQLLTEEATNGNPWSPDTRTLGLISRAAFEVDDYWRIVEILHNRLSKFDRNNWRPSYKALIVLERLLTHGPESVAEEFRDEKVVIKQMQFFQHIDEKGFNWGLAVRKKSERLLELLEKRPVLKEERHRARKLTREIKGFGSFTNRISSEPQGVLEEENSSAAPSHETYGRCHSQFNEHGNRDTINCEDSSLNKKMVYEQQLNPGGGANDRETWFENNLKIEREGSKENMAPSPVVCTSIDGGKLHRWNGKEEEANSLLENGGRLPVEEEEEGHPFIALDKVSKVSLLA